MLLADPASPSPAARRKQLLLRQEHGLEKAASPPELARHCLQLGLSPARLANGPWTRLRKAVTKQAFLLLNEGLAKKWGWFSGLFLRIASVKAPSCLLLPLHQLGNLSFRTVNRSLVPLGDTLDVNQTQAIPFWSTDGKGDEENASAVPACLQNEEELGVWAVSEGRGLL